jgi:hypothetical protein
MSTDVSDDKSILPDTGSDSDFADMMDHDASKFVEAPVVDGESLAKDADAIGEALDESPSPTKAPASSSSDKSDSSDAQPDGITLLRNQAQQFGYTAEDVQSLDEQSLRQLLDVQSDLMGRAGQQPQQFAPQFAPQPQQFQPGYGQQPQVPPQQIPFYKVDLPTEGVPEPYDPTLVGKLNEMSAYYAQQLAQMQQNLAAQQQQAMQVQQAAFAAQQLARDQADSRELDSWMEGQGDSFSPLFGGKNITPNSPQFKVRAQVFQEARRLQQQAYATNTPVDANWVREQAARNVVGKDRYEFFKQQAQRQPIAKRQGQMLNRANGTAPRTRTGRDAAADNAEAFFKQRGL